MMSKEEREFLRKIAKEVESWPEWRKEHFGPWETYKEQPHLGKTDLVEKFRALNAEMPKDRIKDEIRSVLREKGPISSAEIRTKVEFGVDEEDFREILKEMVGGGELEIKYYFGCRLYYFKG